MTKISIYRRLPLVLALGASLAMARPVAAQSADDLLTARTLAAEANKKKTLDPKGAIDLFNRAFTLAPSPSVRLETGRLHLILNELIDAESDFREAMSVTKKGEPPIWKDARTRAADEITKLEGRAPFVVISVPPEVKTNLRVFVDGKQVPAAAIGVRRAVNPGNRIITAEADGFQPVRKEVTLKERSTVDVPLVFEANAPPPATSSSGPVEPPPPPPPPTASVAPMPPPAPPPPAPVEKGGYGLAIGGFTTAVIFGGVGTTLGILAKNKFAEFKGTCIQKHCPSDKSGEGKEARGYALASTGTFVVAGAFVVLGVVGIFTGGRPKTTAVIPTTDGRQILLQGAF